MRTLYAEGAARHPVFRRDVRRIRWGASETAFRDYSRGVLLRVQVVILCVWLALAGLGYITTPDFMRSAERLTLDAGNAAGILLALLIPAGLALDFISVRAALDSISGEVSAGRWDLLRLTSLHGEGISRAKHAVAQLRAWRGVLVLGGARFAAAWIYCVSYGLLYLTNPVWVSGTPSRPLESALFAVVIVFTLTIYVLEPLWRMKAMTALGMVISTYVLNTPAAMLVGVGMILVVWLAQLVVLVVLFIGLTIFATPIYFSASFIAAFLYLLLAGFITALTIHGFYAIMQSWCLRRVVRRISRDG